MSELELLYEVLEQTDEEIIEGFKKSFIDIRYPLITTLGIGRKIIIAFARGNEKLSVYIEEEGTKFNIEVRVNGYSDSIDINDLILKEVIPNLKALKPKAEELIKGREIKYEEENRVKRELEGQLEDKSMNEKDLIERLTEIRENLKMLKEENEKQIEGYRKAIEDLEERERRRKKRFGRKCK